TVLELLTLLACGSSSSSSSHAPCIDTQPTDQTVAVGQTATFSVAASGSSPLIYQWERNGTKIPGASSASYTTPATSVGDDGAQFQVSVSKFFGDRDQHNRHSARHGRY